MQGNTAHTTSSTYLRLLPHGATQSLNKEEESYMIAQHGQTLYDKAASSFAHLSRSMQKQIVI